MMQLKDCRLRVLDSLLDLVWSQWSCIGVAGSGKTGGNWIIDPEALVLFTCLVGRYEARVFDSMLEWLRVNQRFLNVQRLNTINEQMDLADRSLLSAIARLLMKPVTAAKWMKLSEQIKPGENESTFFFKDGLPHPGTGKIDEAFAGSGFSRSPMVFRGVAEMFNPRLSSNLILKLRGLFGLNSRSEIVAYLLTHEESNPSEIALETGYYSKTVYNTLRDMLQSGLLTKRVHGRETLYGLAGGMWKEFLGTGDIRWVNWPEAFRALSTLWAALSDNQLEGEADSVIAGHLAIALTNATPQLQKAVPGYVRSSSLLQTTGLKTIEEYCGFAQELTEFLK